MSAQCGWSKVYGLMRAGTLASIRIDSCRRVPFEDLTAMIARLRGAGTGGGAEPGPGDS